MAKVGVAAGSARGSGASAGSSRGICDSLWAFFDIEHSTFQIETADQRPIEEVADR